MELLKDKIGTIVKNDGEQLGRELGVEDLIHTGNFCFEATLDGTGVVIMTEPQDEDSEYIMITDIRIHPDAVRKVGITYKMIRGANDNEVAETFIELPISQKRYEELAQGLQPDNKVWFEVRDSLERLTFLQGYTKLGYWNAELKIEK